MELDREAIQMGLCASSDIDAVRMGAELLVQLDCAERPFIEAVIRRHRELSVCMGRGLALAHAVENGRKYVKKEGIVLLQFPEGVDFSGEMVYILVAIAARGIMHIKLLSQVAEAFSRNHFLARQMAEAKTVSEILMLMR